jgi:hypothetical protein
MDIKEKARKISVLRASRLVLALDSSREDSTRTQTSMTIKVLKNREHHRAARFGWSVHRVFQLPILGSTNSKIVKIDSFRKKTSTILACVYLNCPNVGIMSDSRI